MQSNDVISRIITLTAEYEPAGSAGEIGDFKMIAPGDNTGVAYMLGDDGEADVPVPKGIEYPFTLVDLADIQLKGTPGDSVVIIGNTR